MADIRDIIVDALRPLVADTAHVLAFPDYVDIANEWTEGMSAELADAVLAALDRYEGTPITFPGGTAAGRYAVESHRRAEAALQVVAEARALADRKRWSHRDLNRALDAYDREADRG